MTDLDSLEKLAQEATRRKKWRDRPSVHGNQYRYVEIDKAEEYTTCELKPQDARYIAALSPDVCLGLIAALKARDEEIARLRAAATEWAAPFTLWTVKDGKKTPAKQVAENLARELSRRQKIASEAFAATSQKEQS